MNATALVPPTAMQNAVVGQDMPASCVEPAMFEGDVQEVPFQVVSCALPTATQNVAEAQEMEER